MCNRANLYAQFSIFSAGRIDMDQDLVNADTGIVTASKRGHLPQQTLDGSPR
jgi:hypothetical protein